ncbi:hypothetical protein NHX12_020056 [Muraenolepis orangiensis]|uniref:Nanos-type domain-containing protein n=1 Tax=Muraenolepis orangiensis TaxID=630683 RepID=A0A9Q0IX62_9TELE|nr:hypothetical protein NHX12_020056 [Muraenolepis orangiensis]
MDLLDHGLFDARSPYNYTFNFWNDYLGLSTIVAQNNKLHPPSSSTLLSANSITESLKATLGLDDSSCVMGHGGRDGYLSASPPPPPPHSVSSIFDLKERLSHLRPYDPLLRAPGGGEAEREAAAARRERFGAVDELLHHHGLALDRRRNNKQAHGGGAHGGCRSSGKPEPKVCVFCRNNGAPEEVFASHVLKAADGRVLCPILRAYTCPLCSANGDHAHTIKYCPLSREHHPGGGQQPRAAAAKGARTAHKRLAIF